MQLSEERGGLNIAQVQRALENSRFSGWPQDEFDLIEFFVQLRKLTSAGGLSEDTMGIFSTRQ